MQDRRRFKRATADRRRKIRTKADKPGVLILDGAKPQPCKLVDQSPDGLMVVVDELPDSITHAKIAAGRLQYLCRVVWTREYAESNAIGLQIQSIERKPRRFEIPAWAAAALLIGIAAGHHWVL